MDLSKGYKVCLCGAPYVDRRFNMCVVLNMANKIYQSLSGLLPVVYSFCDK